MRTNEQLNVVVLNPMTGQSGNVIRDVLYGCWCAGKRIGGATVPPFSLIQLATVLDKDGQAVEFIDAQAEQKSYSDIAPRVRSADLVVASTSTMTFSEDAAYLSRLKQDNPRLRTAILGSHPTFMPKYALSQEGVDFIVQREPEYIVRDLCRVLGRKGSDDELGAIGGLGFRSKSGEAKVNSHYPFIDDLDQLPYPDTDFLPEKIDYFNPLVQRMPYMTVTTSRGCPAKCTFCTAPYFDGEKVRFQSAEYVVGVIQHLVSKGFREIYFRDDTFFVKKKRDNEIFRQLIEKKIDITWIANARVAMMDEDTMSLAHRAGCHTMKFGIESGNQAILDGMRKGYKLESARRIFRHSKKVGVNTHAHVMLGNPGDTLETIEETIQFVLDLSPTTATFGLCTPYPGTPLFEQVARDYPEIRDGTATNLSNLHVDGTFNELYCDVKKDKLNSLVREAYRRFYLRPSYVAGLAGNQFRSWSDVKRISLAGTRVFDFSVRGA